MCFFFNPLKLAIFKINSSIKNKFMNFYLYCKFCRAKNKFLHIFNFSKKVWEARINKGPHKNEIVAIKEVDLEELSDKSLENCSVKT